MNRNEIPVIIKSMIAVKLSNKRPNCIEVDSQKIQSNNFKLTTLRDKEPHKKQKARQQKK
jgi:hypothetical protein